MKQAWEEPAKDETDDEIDAVLTGLLVIATACFGAFILSLVYQLAQPWVQLWT